MHEKNLLEKCILSTKVARAQSGSTLNPTLSARLPFRHMIWKLLGLIASALAFSERCISKMLKS